VRKSLDQFEAEQNAEQWLKLRNKSIICRRDDLRQKPQEFDGDADAGTCGSEFA